MKQQSVLPDPPPSLPFLLALNRRLGRNMYQGGADPVVVRQRRARNKAARRSRKINRGRS